jgi:ATP-dependent Clp protease ATP-binding subunit ClpA
MTIARRALFGKLNLTLFRGIESATAFAKLRGNPYVELTHWIHQLWQLNDSDLHRVCRHYKVDSQAVEKDFAAALSALPSGATALCDFSHHIETVIERAWVADIVALHLARVVDRMKEQHGIDLTYTPALVAEVIERCDTHEAGARRLIGFIEQKLLPVLSRQWLDALRERRTIKRVSVDVRGDTPVSQGSQGGGAIVCHAEYV